MGVGKIGNLGSIELRAQLRLRAVDDDEIGTERDDAFDVGIEQRADARQLPDFWRKPIVAADRHDAIAGTHGEQHLGGRRNDRDDAVRLGVQRARDGAEQKRNTEPDPRADRVGSAVRRTLPPGAESHANRRNSSHKKKGPPRIAVTVPTGSSTGPNAVRATRSQTMRNEAPNSAAAGSTRR